MYAEVSTPATAVGQGVLRLGGAGPSAAPHYERRRTLLPTYEMICRFELGSFAWLDARVDGVQNWIWLPSGELSCLCRSTAEMATALQFCAIYSGSVVSCRLK